VSVLEDLRAIGLGPVLNVALKRWKKDETFGRSRPDLTPAEWQALWNVTGERKEHLDLKLLDERLRESRFRTGLEAVLEELNGGPVVRTARAQAERKESLAEVIGDVSDADWKDALQQGRGGFAALNRAHAAGTVDLPRTLRLVSGALTELRVSPCALPPLAAHLSGDAHALDKGTLARTLMDAAVQDLDLHEVTRGWITSHTWTANLLGPAWLNACRGHALALPWGEIQDLHDLHSESGNLWVTENPSVFEDLHHHHPYATLICLYGMPNTATRTLLSRTIQSERLHLSTDLDFGGLSIAQHLLTSLPDRNWHLWRMHPDDHHLAVTRGAINVPQDVTGFGTPLDGLAARIATTGLGAHQETLLPELRADLQRVESPARL